eukprot:768782-Hanusia_phi.AAC.5
MNLAGKVLVLLSIPHARPPPLPASCHASVAPCEMPRYLIQHPGPPSDIRRRGPAAAGPGVTV